MTNDRDPLASRTAELEPLVRAAASDDAAMEALLTRVQATAFRFSLRVCGDRADAEDVTQESLLKTYRHVGRIEEPAAFRTWLFRTVRNFCLMKRRKRVNEPSHVLSLDDRAAGDGRSVAAAVADGGPGPEDQAVNDWLGRRLRRALASLMPVDRMIVILREMEGLSTREVAALTKLSEDNVKTRLHRARARLRTQLGES